ncbi:biotin-dependent carboxyltransferase family protein [Jeotgalicoccus halotolerans]|uniref:Antagonist of KipI n=1 Tax=Jeotgalicoccus halotolerans TaxID=157227 RepID=A0A3E0AVV8_9STAP|nr:biotin-dependent carboxyltransferase family protein [Jeotgalicoccus halotolerans]REG23858.1 antagonist of KipI [Jeotgalicoccus halotolerans]
MALKIINPGLFTTVQDLGRYGYESYGFTPAGVMDYESYYLANALLGNDYNCGVLELTLYGITFEVLHSTSMSSAGAEMELTINEEPFETGTAVDLVKGDIVKFGGVKKGARTYIAFSGGLDLPKELGSYSTHTRSQMGGYKGRVLKAGYILPVKGKTVEHNFPVITKILTEDTEIRFIPGQQNDRFDSVNKRIFTESEYTLTKDSDRMGCRLEGPAVGSADDDDILSEPTQFGSIQVPKNGQPIVLLADRQTAGGYKKIGTVAKVDLPKIAQKKPGEKITFTEVSVDEASQLYKDSLKALTDGSYINTSVNFKNARRRDALSITQLIGG